VVVAAISRWSPLFDLVARKATGLFDLNTWWAEIELAGGQRAGTAPAFTTAYFHRARDLRDEMSSSGLIDVHVLGVEGIGGLLDREAERMADPEQAQLLLRAAGITEDEAELAGLSNHLLGIGREPESPDL
jgi:hypothetical protein